MCALDIVLLLCFLPAIYFGIRKGLISQLISIAALILSIWASYKFSEIVAKWLSGFIEVSPTALNILTFVVIFLVIAIVLRILGKLLEKVIKLVMLGWLNKLLGVVFALLKVGIIVGLAIILFNTLNSNFHLVKDEVLDNTVVYSRLKDWAYIVFPYLKGLLFKN